MWVVTVVPEDVNATSEKKEIKNSSVLLIGKLDGQQGLTGSILVLLSDLFSK